MTRPVCVSDALDYLAQRTGVANTVILGYVHQLEHRVAAVQADAAFVRWAREDMAAVEALRAAVAAALDRTDPRRAGGAGWVPGGRARGAGGARCKFCDAQCVCLCHGAAS